MNVQGMALASKYCQGAGLEVGAAAHNAFYLPNCINLGPSDGEAFLYPQDLVDYGHYKRSRQITTSSPPGLMRWAILWTFHFLMRLSIT